MISKAQLEKLSLEALLKYAPLGEAEYNHYFYGDLYIREMRAKANSVILGGVHRNILFPVILISGSVVRFQNGEKEYWKAPHYSMSCPGHSRIFFGLEDYILISIHYTKQRNLDLIEQELCSSKVLQRGILKKETIHEYLGIRSGFCSRDSNRIGYKLHAIQGAEESSAENEGSRGQSQRLPNGS